MAQLLIPLAIAGAGFGLIVPALNDVYRSAKSAVIDEYEYLTESGNYAPKKKDQTISELLKETRNRVNIPTRLKENKIDVMPKV